MLAVLWTVLPFAIFGTKPLLRELIEVTKRNNQLLSQQQSPAAAAPGNGASMQLSVDGTPITKGT